MTKFKLLIISPYYKFYQISNYLTMLNFWKKYFFLFVKYSFPAFDIHFIGGFREGGLNIRAVIKHKPDLVIYFLENIVDLKESSNLYNNLIKDNPYVRFLAVGPYANIFAGAKEIGTTSSYVIITGNCVSQIISFISKHSSCNPVLTEWKEFFELYSVEKILDDIWKQKQLFFESKSVFINLGHPSILMSDIEKSFWTNPLSLPLQFLLGLINKKIMKNGVREFNLLDKDLLFNENVFLNFLELLNEAKIKVSFSGSIESIEKLNKTIINLIKCCNFKSVTFAVLINDDLLNTVEKYKEIWEQLSAKSILTKFKLYIPFSRKKYSYDYINGLFNLFMSLRLTNCEIALQKFADKSNMKVFEKYKLYGDKLINFFELKKVLNNLRI